MISDLNHGQSNARSWQEYQELINNAWAKGPAAYIEAAQRLVEAKAELNRDVFESLTKLNRLNFDSSVSRKLLCIGKNRVLCCAPGHKLPAGWTIAYELSKVKDDVLKAALADGRINPRMKRKDAVELHTPPQPKPASTPADVTSFLSIWKKADQQTRIAILDAIGGDGLLGALSQQVRREIERRVLNHHHKASAKTNSKFNEQAAAALRQALSMQKTTKDKSTTAMGVATSLNMINNLLIKDGVDLNNIVGLVIDLQATVAKPTKKAA